VTLVPSNRRDPRALADNRSAPGCCGEERLREERRINQLPSVHYAIRALGGPVRVAPYATFGSRELAANVLAATRDRRAAIMRNHGTVATGATVAEALSNAEKLEWLAELYLRSRVAGEPSVLSLTDLATVAEAARTVGYRL